jgi:hypothetical protein
MSEVAIETRNQNGTGEMGSALKRGAGGLILAGALILLGFLFLLQNLSLVNTVWAGVWAIVFAAGGAAVIAVYLRDHKSWWALLPGCALLSIGIDTGIAAIAPYIAVRASAGLFLGSVGLAFLLVYLTSRENWWAVIPAGVLFSLGTVAGISPYYARPVIGSLFFFGTAATFLALYILPEMRHRRPWAIWPAIACGALGSMIVLSQIPAGARLWPLVPIAVGGYLIFHTYSPTEQSY